MTSFRKSPASPALRSPERTATPPPAQDFFDEGPEAALQEQDALGNQAVLQRLGIRDTAAGGPLEPPEGPPDASPSGEDVFEGSEAQAEETPAEEPNVGRPPDRTQAASPAPQAGTQPARRRRRRRPRTSARPQFEAATEFGAQATRANPAVLAEDEETFKQMWAAHPHNHQKDPGQNVSSKSVLQEHGLPTGWNTCAIRMSTMLNKTGYTITPAKARAAGITRAPYYSRKSKQYLILSAREMWMYLSKNFRKADAMFPSASKTYRNAAEFKKAFEQDIKPLVQCSRGIVAFEKIFTFSGTGHVDLYDGLRLSDAQEWYPCRRVHLWYVSVPEAGGLP